MRVYLVRNESGQYSDHLSYVERVCATREAAVAYVESIEQSYERCTDAERPWDEDAWETVTGHPTDHRGCWFVDGDHDYDRPCWFIDEYEVME